MSTPRALAPDDSHALSIIICCSVFPCLSTISVIARFIARKQTRVHHGWDDYFVVLALIALFGQLTILILATVYGGVGHHNDNLSPDNIAFQYKMLAAVQFTFGTSIGFMKMSICFLLVRFFGPHKSFRRAAWCALGLCAAWTMMVILIGACLCRPFSYNWNRAQDGHCGHSIAAYIAIAATDIGVDLIIIALPMPWLWGLQMATRTKVGLTVVFALGTLDIIVAILRIYYLVNTSYAPGADFSWASTGTFVWSVIEPSLGVVVACAPVLGPVIRQSLPGKRTSRRLSHPLPWRSRQAHTQNGDAYRGNEMSYAYTLSSPGGDVGASQSGIGGGDEGESLHTSTSRAGSQTSDQDMHIMVRKDIEVELGYRS